MIVAYLIIKNIKPVTKLRTGVITEAYSKQSQISKMEPFAKLVNDLQPFTLFPNRCLTGFLSVKLFLYNA